MSKNVIDMHIDYATCLEFAEGFILDGKYLEAMQNLNEAMALSRKEKRIPAEVYARMLYIMNQTDNIVCAYDVFSKLLVNIRGSSNYYMDNVEALLKDAFPQGEETYDEEENSVFVNMSEIKHREIFIRASEYAKNQNFDKFTAELEFLYRHSGRFQPRVLGLYLNSVAPNIKGAKRAKMMEKLLQMMEEDVKACVPIMEFILSANIKKYIDILEKNFKAQLDEFRDNPYLLMCIGTAYTKAGRFNTAQYFLVNSLASAPYDEETLWAAALNSYLLGRKEEGRRHLNTYAALFSVSNVPVKLYRDFMTKCPEPADYPQVSMDFFVSEYIRCDDNENSGLNYNLLEELFFVATKTYSDWLLNTLEKFREVDFFSVKRAQTILNLLENARIPSELKPQLYAELIHSYYSGPVSIMYESKLYVTDIKRHIFEVHDIFNEAYAELLKLLPFSHEYIPTECRALQNVMKSIYEKDILPVGKNALYQLIYASLVLYTKKIGIKADLELYKDILGVNDRSDFFKKLGISPLKKS